MTDSEKTKKLLAIAGKHPAVHEPIIAALEAHRREGLTIAASGVTRDEKLERIGWLETTTYVRVLRLIVNAGIVVPPELLEPGEEVRRVSNRR